MEQKNKKKNDTRTFSLQDNSSAAHAAISSNKSLVQIAFLIFLIVIVYSNSFDVPFGWDEDTFLFTNPMIKNIHYFTNLAEAKGFENYNFFMLRYVGFLSFALNYKIHGTSVAGYHIVNIVIHIANSILVYLLVLLSFRTPFMADSSIKKNSLYIAFFSSLLFAIHPLQTAAVTYIFQRFVSLAAFFYLLSLTAYVQSRLSESKRQSIFYYSIAFISAVLAMKTKEISFTLPVVITLYEFRFFGGPSLRVPLSKRFYYLAPILLTLSIIPITLMSLSGVHNLYQTREAIEFSRHEYLITQFRVIVTYLRLLLFPLKPYIDYEYPVFKSFFHPQVMLSIVFLTALFGLGVYLVIKSKGFNKVSSPILRLPEVPSLRLVGFGILWFFITLSVESSIVPLSELINEYRVYLPSIGFIMSIVSTIFLLREKARASKIRERMLVMCVIVIGVLSVVTYLRNETYKDKIAIWEATAKRYPARANVHQMLGVAYAERNIIYKAIDQNLIAIKLKPDLMPAHNNLGNNYKDIGMFDKAKEQYLIAINLRPDFAEAHYNLGLVYYKMGQLENARREMITALKIKPDFQEAQQLLTEISDFH